MKENTYKNRGKLALFRYIMLRGRADVIFLLFLEVLFLITLVCSGLIRYVWLRGLFSFIAIVTALFIACSDDNSGYKVFWLILFMVFPSVCVVIYFILSFQKKLLPVKMTCKDNNIKSAEYEIACDEAQEYGEYTPIFNYLRGVGFLTYSNTRAVYFHSGEEMVDALVCELKKAKKSIYLEYFIIDEGFVWSRILSVLTEKARYGVDIRIIMDDMGCFDLHPKHYASQFAESGIEYLVFNPFKPLLSSEQNNRDHRKFAIIDGEVAFTGGINLADEYVNISSPYEYWKDCAVMLKGRAAIGVQKLFLSMWNSCRAESDYEYKNYEAGTADSEVSHDGFFTAFSDSPAEKLRIGRDIYLGIIQRARKFVYISTPYLIPDEFIIESLKRSALSGVDVRIVLPYVPDKKIVKAVGVSYYRELLSAGVKIYEYKAGFNHAKVLYSDGKIGVVGSTNLDYRSMYLNYEGGVLIYSSSVLSEINSDFKGMLRLCREIKVESLKDGVISRFVSAFLRFISPFM